MRDKFILETYNDDGELIDTKKYKTYKEIAEDICCNYSCARCIHNICENRFTYKKRPHREVAHFLSKYKIRDAPFEVSKN